MTKPYSRGGIPPEWRALLRSYVIGGCVVAVLVFVAGFSCGKRSGRGEGEPLRKELAAAAMNATTAYAAVINERAETDAANRQLHDSLATLEQAKLAARRANMYADSLATAAQAGEVPTVPPAVFIAMRDARDSLQRYAGQLEARLTQATVIVETRIPAERLASDTLDHRRVIQIGIADSALARAKPPRCGPKCGGAIAIGALVVGKIAWTALASVLGVHR